MDFKILCLLDDSSTFVQSYMEYLKENSDDKIEYMNLPIAPAMLESKPLTTLVSVLKKKFGDPEKDIDFIFSFNKHYRFLKSNTLPDVPIVELGNSIAGPNYNSRPFMNPKTPCAWEDKVLKIEPKWYNDVLPIERKMIHRVQDSYRYVYLRQVVDTHKASNAGKPDPECMIYVPDWTTHLDNVLNNVYRCLDFCSQQDCGFHLALSSHLLNENDSFYGDNFGIKRDTLNATMKILRTEIQRFSEANPGVISSIGATDEFHHVLARISPRAIFIDPSSTTWLEALYLIKYKGLDCNKIRLIYSTEKKYPQIESKLFDKHLPEIEKYFKEGLFRRDVHSIFGNISTTTDRFYNFIGYHDRALEVLDLKSIKDLFPKK